ncbi:MAG: hypothetical protein R3C10_10180 [Pirellulales bacterium]
MRAALLVWIVFSPCGLVWAAGNWSQFRGPDGEGHAAAERLPLNWSENENVVWKTAIHDRGWSSPVIWGDQVWLTTATRDGHELFAVCLDRATGALSTTFVSSRLPTLSELRRRTRMLRRRR